jgi:hypothetical protein
LLVTVVLAVVRAKTRMTFTEQVTFLDGHGDAEEAAKERREGTLVGLERLDLVLA